MGWVLLLLALQLAPWDLDDLVLPRKTDIFLTLERGLDSRTATPGDKFYARVAVPVTLEDRIVLPVGTYVIGHIDTAHKAGRVKGKSSLVLAFDTVILPSGITRHLEAAVQSAEGYASPPQDERGTIEASGSQAGETAEGAAAGAVTGGIVGVVADSSFRGLGLGSAIGGGVGALAGLFRKGKDVHLPRGTSLTIQLTQDVRFVRPQPRPRGRPLKP